MLAEDSVRVNCAGRLNRRVAKPQYLKLRLSFDMKRVAQAIKWKK
jgi:hypothetical protein